MANPGTPETHREKVDFTGVRWGSVEWTLLCMLYLRACESRLAHPILGDRFAAQDVERIDYDWERVHRAVRPAVNQFGVALRGAQFDALVTGYLREHPDTTVLHLGCGLHSRAMRLATPPEVRWFDVDVPQVISLRRQLYGETGRYRMIGSSITDRDWLDQIPAGGPVLIVAEGVLMYLTPDEVKSLLNRLLDRFGTGELLADLLSPWGPRLSRSGIIKWGTRDGREITDWDARLHLIGESSVIAGFEKIPLTSPRLLYRMQNAIRTTRNYDRLFRYAF
ncbi:class I SAM-dependent methyltransferase [Mycobacterium sp. E740]|uniref:class I SAM-dependent methyltransferase n=1 Tax=Mycobacterium sp. E740 TaxID=1834149 RepID=UPI0007FCA785|nr:class I SAM-dependent methyltransferase [Mycobacterium sp. E740]OBI72030.1 methyltransferase [Mycobacterium sp. E740]